MHKTTLYIFVLLFAAIIFNCGLRDPFGDERDSNPVGNLPPETHLFLHVDQQQATVYDTLSSGEIVSKLITTGLDTTPSRQIISWWGDDSDGNVVGYFYQWDYQAGPQYTLQERDTFYVPIRSKYDEFTFKVWAIDNEGAEDQSPATLRFPVFNTPPTIQFKLNSNPRAIGNDEVINRTFPTRTFYWDAFDLDGQETITAIWYTLDDTTNWSQLPGDADNVTLSEINAGEHRFFVRAQDISGAYSQTISYPDPEDSAVPNYWQVQETNGDILLVNDFAQDQNLYQVQSFYTDILDELVGRDGYSVWEIGTDRTPAVNAQNSLPFSAIDIEANLSYFKKVIWFSHLGRPNITGAGLSITRFVKNGGKIFISNGNEEQPDTTWTFTNIDSVYRLNPGGRLLPGINVLASFGTEQDVNYDLNVERLIGNRVSAIVPGPGSETIYSMEPDTVTTVSVPYKGSPPVGIRYKIGSGESIYFTLPLHYCNGNLNMTEVLQFILFEEFGP